MLTRRQRDLVTFIDAETQRRGGVCPTYEEMAAGIGIKAKSRIHRMLLSCEERGAVKRHKSHRSVEVIRLKPRVKWFYFDEEEKCLKPFKGAPT